MDIQVLNKNFERIAIIDTYESLLWVDRHYQPGEFEIYTPITSKILEFSIPGYYLQSRESEHTMIIENLDVESDVESGNHIKVTGRSLESILDRRIVWEQTNLTGNLQEGLKRLITDAIISPTISDRKISNFVFVDSTDPAITSLTLEAQYTGDNLLEIIVDVCKNNEIGFKVILNDNGQFEFSLYKGVDRSYRQDPLPYVVFKPSFENIINSKYTEKHSESKNVALVAGEGEGTDRKTRVVGAETGLDRRELYTDARDISKDDLTDDQYNAKLDQRGTDQLKEYKVKKAFEGECETTRMFVYLEDFFMGDCVQVANEYGMEAPSRVVEYIWSSDENGTISYPTFEALEYEAS